ncbi:MAG: S8 family serine peptidase [Gammaproteobacteria bacterium]|nr:S8 family serine peptidase [Gammaproteobacteria bacterium]MDP6734419.1 S8 family serine peptidase [Gammaproteobacteria bacterium]
MNNVMQKVLNLVAATAITMAVGAPMQVSAADFTLKITDANSRTLPATRKINIDRRSMRSNKTKQRTNSRNPMTESVHVIVRFKARWQLEGNLGSNAERQKQRNLTQRTAKRFVASLRQYKPQEVRTYETLPLVSMVVQREDLERLRKHPLVVAVQEDIPEQMHLASSLPVVGADDVQASGYGGEGQTVVIIDTGVDVNNNPNNFTAGQIVAQGCFNPATSNPAAPPPNGTITNLCPGGAVSLVGPAATNQNAGDDICGPPVGAVGTCEHGTHVASIAAGINGVAPQADIISLQVFHLRTNPNPLPPVPGTPGLPPGTVTVAPANLVCANQGAGAQCVLARQADSLAALNQVAVLVDSFDIAAVNMSLGGGTNIAACDGDLRKVAIDNLRSRGVATVISSGNDGFVNAMEAPACISTAISVGNTVDTTLPAADNATGAGGYAQDLVWRSSNVAPFLDLHAPGTLIVGGAPVNSPCDNGFGAVGDGQCGMTGTSMAAPHVTGAWAALKSLNPAARIEDVLAVLQATGVAVADNRLNTWNGNAWTGNAGAGTQVPRVQLDLAMERFDPHRGSIAMGDFNCDGDQDIAMGSPNQVVNGLADAGEVSILYGSSKGAIPLFNRHINQNSSDQNGNDVAGAAEAGDRFGQSLAAGDFNNDGCDDLAVGVPFESIGLIKTGAVQVFYGGPLGFDMSIDQFWHQNSSDVPGANEEGDKFGWSLATGDFDNDGRDDLAIGNPTEAIGAVPASGAVTIIYGHGAGLDAYDSDMWHQDNLPLSVEAGDLFGYAVTTGHFNNGQHSDLAIGAPRETSITGNDIGQDAGAVTVLYGSATGVNSNGFDYFHQGVLNNVALESGDGFGFSLASGNFGSDNFSDLVVGVPFEDLEYANSTVENAGIVHVIQGSPGGLTLAGNTNWHQNTANINGAAEADDYFGYSLAGGDLNADNFDELIVGIPFEDIGAKVDAGAINIIRGSQWGLTAQGDQMKYQDANNTQGSSEDFDRFGEAAVAGNIKPTIGPDHNTLKLAVRVSNEDNDDSGAVHNFYGPAATMFAPGGWNQVVILNNF